MRRARHLYAHNRLPGAAYLGIPDFLVQYCLLSMQTNNAGNPTIPTGAAPPQPSQTRRTLNSSNMIVADGTAGAAQQHQRKHQRDHHNRQHGQFDHETVQRRLRLFMQFAVFGG